MDSNVHSGVRRGRAVVLRHRHARRKHGTPAHPDVDGHHHDAARHHRRGRPAAHPAPRTRNWFDLDVGDCLTVLPRIDLGDVAVPVADCAIPHAAEVFLRAPVEVNAAIAHVADHKCAAGLARYTGRSGPVPTR